MAIPIITKIEIESYTWEVEGMALGRVHHYDPDATCTRAGVGIRIHSDAGVVGEYVGYSADPRTVAGMAKGYIGRPVTDRETFYQKNKSSSAMGMLDIALWDLAGKMAGLPIHALIGTYRTKVPAYASMFNGAVKGPLSTPDSYADYAEQCLSMGYRGFKIHPFAWPDARTHIQAVQALGRRVGGKMDLMLDPYCFYQTFARPYKSGEPVMRPHSTGTKIRMKTEVSPHSAMPGSER